MNEKDTLSPYVRSHLQQGVPADVIRQQLLDKGWGTDIVDSVISEVSSSLPPAQTVSPSVQPQPLSQSIVNSADAATTSTVKESEERNYGIRSAFSEAISALRTNAAAMSILMIFAATVSALLFVVIILAGVAGVISSGRINLSSLFSSAMLIPFVVLFGTFAMLITAYVQTLIGLAINDGAEGKKSNIRQTIVTGAKRMFRVLAASLLYGLITTTPLLIVALLIFIVAPSLSGSASIAILLFLFVAACIGVSLVFGLRFILMPYVALFETSTPLFQVPSRTKLLMKNGGILFIVKYFLVLLLANLVLSGILESTDSRGNDYNPLMFGSLILQLLVSLIASAMLIVFYRHRRALKDISRS